jgi:ankyrin repeat protein
MNTKRLFSIILLVFLSVSGIQAQTFRVTFGKKKSAQKEEKSNNKPNEIVVPSILPPLGIEDPHFESTGSPGSRYYNLGLEGYARTKANYGGEYPANKDATKFLEKAVRENNLANAKRFLEIGASAFISYEMIDKKQYDMIDAMYNDNPKIIRFSQILHYACAKSDPEMIDFLIERGASLDLAGHFTRPTGKTFSILGLWNSDYNYRNTPVDCALFYGNWANLNHIITKYNKYPSIYGCSHFLVNCALNENNDNDNLKLIKGFITGSDSRFKFMNNVDYSIVDAVNLGYHYIGQNAQSILGKIEQELKSEYLLNVVISKIAQYRRFKNPKDKEFVDLLNILLDKGVNPNNEVDQGSAWRAQHSVGINVTNYVNTTPMYIAVTNPGMLDIVKLLRSKGASMTTTANGKQVSIAKLGGILDEYKEYFMLEGIE